ncbi:glycoside hydrolase family 16 protein [Sphingobacterium hotanense]|uniref:Glycoside hydrolase family 16 protein n=1 Tax=Sphingobacterium hotanense TaxID=649196 RepID=A0ABT7NKE6_9SPHI|nr:glycoside hydrolase family 16 protein [Sphingobacterium hotanense]MDM1047687.1 glycoside hydrolase family 16 protein [Sphingobacterium hotanense]
MKKSNILNYTLLGFLTLAIAIVACSASKQTPKPDPESSKPEKEEEEEPNDPNNKVVFFEDFSGALNDDRWGIMTLPYSSGNKESQWYRAENLVVSEGTLKIIAKKETTTGPAYQAPLMSLISNDGVMRANPMQEFPDGVRYWTSGLMNTRDAKKPTYFPLFGKFEIKAKVPHGQGLLPAFWLRRIGGASWGEVDIMENFGNNKPGYSKFSLHFPNTIGINATQQTKFFDTSVPGSSNWHVWSVVIEPANEHADPLKDPIKFTAYLDGEQCAYYKLTHEQTIRDLHMIDRTTGQKKDPNNPDLSWDLCVNMAVGGAWVGQPDQQLGYLPIPNRCSLGNQPRPTDDDPTGCSTEGLFFAQFPAVFEIDYIKVEKL